MPATLPDAAVPAKVKVIVAAEAMPAEAGSGARQAGANSRFARREGLASNVIPTPILTRLRARTADPGSRQLRGASLQATSGGSLRDHAPPPSRETGDLAEANRAAIATFRVSAATRSGVEPARVVGVRRFCRFGPP